MVKTQEGDYQVRKACRRAVLHHSFFVTNFEIASPQDIIKAYKKRGTMESYIKEAKMAFTWTK